MATVKVRRPADWPQRWRGATWKAGREKPVTEADLLTVLLLLPDHDAILRVLGCGGFSARRADRAMQLLKGAGYARYDRANGWQRVAPVAWGDLETFESAQP